MWVTFFVILVLGAVAYMIYRRRRGRSAPEDTYICDICGEKHCMCHSEAKGTGLS